MSKNVHFILVDSDNMMLLIQQNPFVQPYETGWHIPCFKYSDSSQVLEILARILNGEEYETVQTLEVFGDNTVILVNLAVPIDEEKICSEFYDYMLIDRAMMTMPVLSKFSHQIFNEHRNKILEIQ